MKASRYNFFVEGDHGEILAYNAFTGAFASIGSELYGQYLKACAHRGPADGQDLSGAISKFQKGGFLIADQADEIEMLIRKQHDSRFQQGNLMGLTIAPTLDCNFNCVYCYESGCRERYRMTRETADRIIEYIDKFSPEGGFLRIAWFGGEPTVALDMVYYISDAVLDTVSKKRIDYSSTITTNGYLLDKKTASELKNRGLREVCITVDGCAESHNARRMLRNGAGTFDAIMENLRNISGMVDVWVRYSVDRENAEEFPAFLDLLEESGIAGKISMEIVMTEAYPYSNEAVKKRSLTTREFSGIFSELAGQVVERNIRINLLPTPDRSACSALRSNHVLIGPRGELYKCVNTVWDPAESFGRIDRPAEQNPNLVKWLYRSPMDNEKCKSCRILPLCMGGCLRNRLMKDTAPINTEGCCMQYRYNIEKILKLKFRQNIMARKCTG